MTITMGLAISFALGGLGLFLVSIRLMSNSMKVMSSGHMVSLLKRFSKNKYLSLFFGIVFTMLIQSSDGAVALSIGLIGAGFMTLKGAIPFVLGANIGTTITAIFVYLGGSGATQFTQYFMIFAFIGGFAYLLIKEEKKSNIAMLLFSFGALFIGLKVMGLGVKEIAKQPAFIDTVKALSFNSWIGALSLYGLTGILQSSSATITIVQNVYGSTGGIPIEGIIGMIVGLNIGTTMTGLIASIGGPKDTKRITFVWFFVNLTIGFGTLLFTPLIANGIHSITPLNNQQDKMLTIALVDILFNVILAFIFIWLVTPLEKFSKWIIKDKKSKHPYEIHLPQELLNEQPSLAFEATKKATQELGKMSLDSISTLRNYLKTGDKEELKKYKNLISLIDTTRKLLNNYLIEIASKNIAKKTSNQHIYIVLSVRSLERIPVIGDHLLEELNLYNKKNVVSLEKDIVNEFTILLNIVKMITEKGLKQINRYSRKRKENLEALTHKFDDTLHEYIKLHLKRKTKEDFDYIAGIKIIERMSHHAMRLQRYTRSANKEVNIVKLDKKLEKKLSENI